MKKLLALILLKSIWLLSIDAMEMRSESSFFASSAVDTQMVLGNRPDTIQVAVDKSFIEIKDKPLSSLMWNYVGDIKAGYDLLDVDETLVLKKLISKLQRDIYILDVGCGLGAWGLFVQEFLLENDECLNSGKHFHIFSITGGKECENCVIDDKNVTIYQFNQFKIENIEEEFLKRGIHFQFDLIVSSFTLIHLVDPIGTLKQLFNRLNPSGGMLLSHGFVFAINNSTATQKFPEANWVISQSLNPNALFFYEKNRLGYGHFALIRNSCEALAIPLRYSGNVRRLSDPDSRYKDLLVTVFDRTNDENFMQSPDQSGMALHTFLQK